MAIKQRRMGIFIPIIIFILLIIFIISYFIKNPDEMNYYKRKQKFMGAMSKFQIYVELYASQNGSYPPNVEELVKDGKSKSYWRDIRNPFFPGKNFCPLINMKKLPGPDEKIFSENVLPGTIAYFVEKNGQKQHYVVYGIERDRKFIVDDKNKQMYFLEGDK